MNLIVGKIRKNAASRYLKTPRVFSARDRMAQAGTIAYCKMPAAIFEMMRGDFRARPPLTTALAELAQLLNKT